MKAVKLCLPICLLVMCLCACSGVKETTQEQMVIDLSLSDTFHELDSMNPMGIKSLEVRKRQTSIEDKVDTTWVTVDAENGNSTGILYYVLTYGLYNDGWHLDKVEEDHTETWSFAPKAGPSQELIAQWLPDGAEIIDDTLWLEDGQENITYSYTQSYPYCETTRKECMTFTFDCVNTGLWSMFNVVTLSDETTWNVCGQYDLYEDGTRTGKTATIFEFSPNRVVWQLDSQPDYLREGTPVDVSSYSVTDYFMNHIGNSSDKEMVLRYSYTFTLDNIDWNEIRYASGAGGMLIGRNHIYAMLDAEIQRDAQREIPYTLRYELIPIAE